MKKLAIVLMLIVLTTPAWAANIGVNALSATTSGMPGLYFGLTKDLSVGAGVTYTKNIDQSSSTGMTLRLDNIVARSAQVNLYLGASVIVTSATTNLGVNTSSNTLSGYVGVEYFMARDLSLFTDVNILSYTSNGLNSTGSTTFLSNGAPVYTGLKYYL